MPFAGRSSKGGKHYASGLKRVSTDNVHFEEKGASDFIRLPTDDKLFLLWNTVEEIKEVARAAGENLQEVKRDFEKLMQKVEELNDENELLRRELIHMNIRIAGIAEDKNETPDETEKKVKDLLSKMGVKEIHIADVRRIGRKTGKPRPIIINLTRKQDKLAILEAKKKLGAYPELKAIYIQPEKTAKESKEDKLLRDTGKIWKCANPAAKIRIRNGVLSVDNNGVVELYRVDRDGRVEKLT